MTDQVFTGRQVSLLYGVESSWGSSTTPTRDFCLVDSVSISEKNNLNVVHALGSAGPQAIVEGKYEISGSISGVLQHAEILEYIIGPATDSGSGPYTHTLTPANEVSSLTLGVGFGSDGHRIFGVYLTSITLSLAVGEPAKIKMDWIGQKIMLNVGSSAAVISTDEPFSFAMGTIQKDGTDIAFVESAEFTFNRKADAVHDINTGRVPSAIVTDTWDGEFKLTCKFNNSSTNLWPDFLGSSVTPADTLSGVTITLILDNGRSGTDQRKITITMTDLKFDTHDPELKVNDYGTVSLSGKFKGLTVEAVDNTPNWDA